MRPLKNESLIMALCRQLGLQAVAWKVRRLHCPVDADALVLDVGSGGNPYPRANVLLDAYVETGQRYWEPLVHDRPTVLGFAERLPFRDKVFDFVIASHCLEHSPYPNQLLDELQRVAKAGYIETPDALMERLHPYPDHRSEITLRDGRLLIRKKREWKLDAELCDLYENRAKEVISRHTIPSNPFAFHVRYYWHGCIDYVVLNPETDSSWNAVSDAREPTAADALGRKCYRALRAGLTTVFSQRARNRAVTLLDLLACPVCGSSRLVQDEVRVLCNECSTEYEIQHGMPAMYGRETNQ